MAVAVCFALTAYVVAAATLSEYRATASLIIEDHLPSHSELRGAIYDADRTAEWRSQLTDLHRGDLVDQVIERSGLKQRLAVSRLSPKPNGPAELLRAVRDRFDVASPDGGRELQVSFTADEPVLAQSVVNELANLYVEKLQHRYEQDGAAEKQLRQKALQAAEDEVSTASQRVERMRASLIAATQPAQDEDSQQLSEELERLQLSREDDERKAAEIRSAITEGNAERFVNAQSMPVVRQLIEVKAHILEQTGKLSKTLPADHPRRTELASDLAGIDRQLATHAAKTADQLEQSALETKAQEAKLKAKARSFRRTRPVSLTDLASIGVAEQNLAAKQEALNALRARSEQSATLPITLRPASAASVVVSARAHTIAATIGWIGFMIGVAAMLVTVRGRSSQD